VFFGKQQQHGSSLSDNRFTISPISSPSTILILNKYNFKPTPCYLKTHHIEKDTHSLKRQRKRGKEPKIYQELISRFIIIPTIKKKKQIRLKKLKCMIIRKKRKEKERVK
jgi:hypothetical protein